LSKDDGADLEDEDHQEGEQVADVNNNKLSQLVLGHVLELRERAVGSLGVGTVVSNLGNQEEQAVHDGNQSKDEDQKLRDPVLQKSEGVREEKNSERTSGQQRTNRSHPVARLAAPLQCKN
jgi:hypothetical protein